MTTDEIKQQLDHIFSHLTARSRFYDFVIYELRVRDAEIERLKKQFDSSHENLADMPQEDK